MRTIIVKITCLIAAVACLVSAGCSSPNVNPPTARARTGYVDFYTETNLGLSWEVKRGSGTNGTLRTVFSEFKPVDGTILRLAAPPGTHRFQVWFNNELTEGPQSISVQVAEGKITPVCVTLTSLRTNWVYRRANENRVTTRGIHRVSTDEGVVFRIGTAVTTPRPYLPKEQMPYWSRQTPN